MHPFSRLSLLRFDVLGVLAAEGAILIHLELFGRIFLVLHGVVVPLLALAASQGDLDPRTCFRHYFGTSL
jgi:hypothetical protein